jgi:hypothetical protein
MGADVLLFMDLDLVKDETLKTMGIFGNTLIHLAVDVPRWRPNDDRDRHAEEFVKHCSFIPPSMVLLERGLGITYVI